MILNCPKIAICTMIAVLSLVAPASAAEFEPIAQVLIVQRTDPARPLVVFWTHMFTGRGMVSLSQPNGEQCILAFLESA